MTFIPSTNRLRSQSQTTRIPSYFLVISFAAVLLLFLPVQADSRWKPKPTAKSWQFQLQGKVDLSVPAKIYETDGFETSRKTVNKLHQKSRRAICYINAGSWENFRPDKNQFPKEVLGKKYSGYPDERWLDIRRYRKFAKPLKQRLNLCARKGFDGVEADNVDGWQNKTGFPISRADQLEFNRWLARQAHRRGLAIGLKNAGPLARQLSKSFDFAVVEECFQYNECHPYKNFIRRNKAVFAVEYSLGLNEFCQRANRYRFLAIKKRPLLFARPWQTCR